MALTVELEFPIAGVSGVKTLNSTTQFFTCTHTIAGDEQWDYVRIYVNDELKYEIHQTPSLDPGTRSYNWSVDYFNLGVENSWYISVKGATSGVWYESFPSTFTPHISGYYSVFNASKQFPTSYSTGVTTDPLLQWNAGTYADGYNLIVDYYSGGVWHNVVNNIDVGNVLSYQLNDLLSETYYRWKVIAYYKDIYRTKSVDPYYTFYEFIYSTTASNGYFTTQASAPSKAINPAPTNAADDVTLDQTEATWEDGGGATSYNVYYGDTSGDLTLVSEGQAGLSLTVTGITLGSPYNYAITRYWRIDSVNAAGTTTGDEWSFTTIDFDQLRVSYNLIAGGSGAGPYGTTTDGGETFDGVPGEEGVDWYYTGENNMVTIKRLVAIANNKFWYEDV